MYKKSLLTATIVVLAFFTQAQTNITGKIYSKNGAAVPHVTVELQDLKLFSTSDSTGEFTFTNINNGTYYLVASSAGLQTQRLKVRVVNNEIFMDRLVLAEQINDLEVVLLTSRKSLNTQPISAGKVAIDPMDLPQR